MAQVYLLFRKPLQQVHCSHVSPLERNKRISLLMFGFSWKTLGNYILWDNFSEIDSLLYVELCVQAFGLSYIVINKSFLLFLAEKGSGNLLRTSLPPTVRYRLSLQYLSRALRHAALERKLYVYLCIPWLYEPESVRHEQHDLLSYLTLNYKLSLGN